MHTDVIPSKIEVEEHNPTNLSDDDIMTLGEVMQDVWADGLGEFVQCMDCAKIYSKKDIFGGMPDAQYRQTVKRIMGDLEDDTIRCICCHGRVRFLYGSEHIGTIKNRLRNTRKAFLVIARNTQGEIVGFEDAYVDTFPGIFRREYFHHYGPMGQEKLLYHISETLGYKSPEFVAISDIGLRTGYRSFYNTFMILNRISRVMGEEYDNIPGCSELHEGDGVYRVSLAIGGKPLSLRKNPDTESLITNTRPEYQSEIVVCDRVTEAYRKYFGSSVRHFLRLTKMPQEERLVTSGT